MRSANFLKCIFFFTLTPNPPVWQKELSNHFLLSNICLFLCRLSHCLHQWKNSRSSKLSLCQFNSFIYKKLHWIVTKMSLLARRKMHECNLVFLSSLIFSIEWFCVANNKIFPLYYFLTLDHFIITLLWFEKFVLYS
jgi:hypothetical protein